MAGKWGGRVFAGEDSEEESEEEAEIQYSFQFASSASTSSSFGAPAPTAAAPRFSVPTPVAAGNEGSDEDESDGDAPPMASAAKAVVTAPVAAAGEDSEEEDDDDDEGALALSGLQQQNASSEARSSEEPSAAAPLQAAPPTEPAAAAAVKAAAVTPPPAPQQQEKLEPPAQLQKLGIEDDDAHWPLGGEIDGVQVMGDAIVARLQPSLDDSITRIAELTESQQELLQLLTTQHASICANEQIKKVAVVMDKLPHYIRKIQDIKAAMAEISASVDRMKKRGESLRVDAQSHALKKENQRDSMAQWNKLHAAGRSSEEQAAK